MNCRPRSCIFVGRMKSELKRSSMKFILVVVISLVVSVTSACHHAASQPDESDGPANVESGDVSRDYAAPVRLAKLEDGAIDESSGVAASRRNPGLFWTHNDSGDGPFLYAFDRAGGKRGTWRVAGARAFDWEDMAAGPGPQAGQAYLYVGDIGDNDRSRREIVVYRVTEPVVTDADADTNRFEPQETEAA